MITKEIVEGEEVFAVEHAGPAAKCGPCMFNDHSSHCSKIKCMTSERGGKAGVYFRPIHDLKALAAYHAQEAMK